MQRFFSRDSAREEEEFSFTRLFVYFHFLAMVGVAPSWDECKSSGGGEKGGSNNRSWPIENRYYVLGRNPINGGSIFGRIGRARERFRTRETYVSRYQFDPVFDIEIPMERRIFSYAFPINREYRVSGKESRGRVWVVEFLITSTQLRSLSPLVFIFPISPLPSLSFFFFFFFNQRQAKQTKVEKSRGSFQGSWTSVLLNNYHSLARRLR